MADKVLFIAACHHIIAVTQVLLEKINYTCHQYILTGCRYKQPHIKNGDRVFFYQGVNQSEHEAVKKLLVWC